MQSTVDGAIESARATKRGGAWMNGYRWQSRVGGEVLPGSTEMFANLIRAERQRYDKLVRDNQIKPD